jgi:hypothetical protein
MDKELQPGTQIRSLDEVPNVARTASREAFIRQWYHALALAPVTVVVFISLKFFPDTPAVFMTLLYATLVWAMAVVAYAFYTTFWGFHCPVCGWRFGIGENCSSCGLPRHTDEELT